MMKNRGNTGHRYRMVTLVDARIEQGQVLHVLACGHTHRSPVYSDKTLAGVRAYIGTKERCYQCAEKKEQGMLSREYKVVEIEGKYYPMKHEYGSWYFLSDGTGTWLQFLTEGAKCYASEKRAYNVANALYRASIRRSTRDAGVVQ